jgi:toxin-antitoxin system PIN domain toxin
MRCVDVNVLVNAHRMDAPDHDRFAAWIDAYRGGAEPIGLSSQVLSGFIRIVTHPRVFREPTPLEMAFRFVQVLRTSTAVMPLEPGDRHLGIFAELCDAVGATGNVVPDAYLAALAIESGATWVTADRGFARFPGLIWEHPLDG